MLSKIWFPQDRLNLIKFWLMLSEPRRKAYDEGVESLSSSLVF